MGTNKTHAIFFYTFIEPSFWESFISFTLILLFVVSRTTMWKKTKNKYKSVVIHFFSCRAPSIY